MKQLLTALAQASTPAELLKIAELINKLAK